MLENGRTKTAKANADWGFQIEQLVEDRFGVFVFGGLNPKLLNAEKNCHLTMVT
jgi:hypothetical protein